LKRTELIKLLACPDCRQGLTALAHITANGDIYDGYLVCELCSQLKARVENFQIDFLHFDRSVSLESVRAKSARAETRNLASRREVVYADDSRLKYEGGWDVIDGKYRFSHGQSPSDRLVFSDVFKSLHVSFLKHSWSGKVRIRVDGERERVIDLFNENGSVLEEIEVAANLEPGQHLVEILPACEKNPKSQGKQVIFDKLIFVSPLQEPLVYVSRALNRGNGFPSKFTETLKTLPANAAILDLGGGDRRVADQRYINLEYMKSDGPDLFADGHKLPFKNDSIDFLMSQAVLEHVYNPFEFANEIRRVMKPGGEIYIEAAFMQPLHAAPHHYFNSTLWGIEEVFKSFKKLESGCFGGLAFTMGWFLSSVNAHSKVSEEKISAIAETLKELDQKLSPDELRHVASSVYFLGEKDLASA